MSLARAGISLVNAMVMRRSNFHPTTTLPVACSRGIGAHTPLKSISAALHYRMTVL
jgi:hypothetical protein